MSARVQVILDEKELSAIRDRARRERLSLSAWMRAAAMARLEERHNRKLRTPAELKAFFLACDKREKGHEPDWDEHLATMARSRSGGAGKS